MYYFGFDGLWKGAAKPIFRLVVFISIGLFVGQVLESTGYSAKIGKAVQPLTRRAHLPHQSAVAFAAAFVSGVTANSLLLHQLEGRRHQPEGTGTKQSPECEPAVLPASSADDAVHPCAACRLGGADLSGLTFSAAVLRFAATVGLSHWMLPKREEFPGSGGPTPVKGRDAWAEIWEKFRSRLLRIFVMIVPIYLAVSLAAKQGLFDWLRDVLTGLMVHTIIPVEAMSLVVFSIAAEFTSGVAAAGALLQAGELGVKEVVLALMIGSMAAAPVRALRHQLSHYMAIFSPKQGLTLLVIGQSSRLVSLLVVSVLFAVFW